MQYKAKISEMIINDCLLDLSCSSVRDLTNPLLQLRFNKVRSGGSWRIYYRNRWFKVGEWPEVKTRDLRSKFSALLEKIRNKQSARVTKDCFLLVGDLLVWYKDRMAENANLSAQRKADIKSTVKCHLMPNLAKVNILDIDKNLIDRLLVWPLQKTLSKSSVVKKFHILKSAFKDASDLDLLPVHPLSNYRISDFGDFSESVSESMLKPRMVKTLLDEVVDQPLYLRLICMLMLSLGTRIGETIIAKWQSFHLVHGESASWDIPKADTKTKTAITIHLPHEVIQMLIEWRTIQKEQRYNGKFLFPNYQHTDPLRYEVVRIAMHKFSAGKWSSHDLRKCARQCWEEQGVDGLVAERMLNHTLGKTTRAYTGHAYNLRFAALKNHCQWLVKQNKNCFVLNPYTTSTTPSSNKELSKNGALRGF